MASLAGSFKPRSVRRPRHGKGWSESAPAAEGLAAEMGRRRRPGTVAGIAGGSPWPRKIVPTNPPPKPLTTCGPRWPCCGGPWKGWLQRLSKAQRRMAAVTGAIHGARVDRRKLTAASLASAVVGVAAWIGLSGPIARALPDPWQLPERMAAATLAIPRWQAGSRLMVKADANAWRVLAEGGQLMRANEGAIRSCRTKAARGGRPVSCQIKVAP